MSDEPDKEPHWKKSLSEFDRDYAAFVENEQTRKEQMTMAEAPTVAAKYFRKRAKEQRKSSKSKKRTGVLSKRDIRILLILRQVLSDHERIESRKIEYVVSKVELKQKSNTIFHAVFKVLQESGKTPLHINDIISKVEESGFILKSKYHKYSQVYNAILRNDSLFFKVKSGTFRLRDGFLPQPVIEKVSKTTADDNTIPSLRIIANKIIAKYKSLNRELSPVEVWGLMDQMGYDCSPRYLQEVLKSK